MMALISETDSIALLNKHYTISSIHYWIRCAVFLAYVGLK